MNTTAAALQAHVTTATIRTWARRGVIAATKTSGRWVINAASLAHRIAIAAMRTRKATPAVDLNATYTYTRVGEIAPVTLTPVVKARIKNGMTLTTVRRLAPLLADHINNIPDEGDRLHVLTLLEGAIIVIADQARPGLDPTTVRDEGRIATTYRGTRHLPMSVVLDLGEQLRTALTAR